MSLRQFMSLRPLTRALTAVKNGVVHGWSETARMLGLQEDLYTNPLYRPLERPVTVVLIGAGHRGTIYASFAARNPSEMQVVAIAEPNAHRRDRLARIHGVPPERCFDSWEQVFEQPRLGDAVIIATPDPLHSGPCLHALDQGYDVLLEKPIAPTEAECRAILAKAQATGRLVSVCHVLRYTPYFREVKALLDQGLIGQLVSIQHLEPIEHVHMSHSYVRGHWRNSARTTPIILAKSCHDTDIIRWLVGDHADNVHCFGNLKWFTNANAPVGSTERCTDGCAVEHECPYSALQIYLRDRKRLYVFDLPEDSTQWDALILKSLNMLFRNGVTAAFSMEAFVSYEGRRTRIMGSLGDVTGDMESFTLTTFKDGSRRSWTLKTDAHGGGDFPMVRDWVQAVAQQNPKLLSSPIEDSVESHLMAFAAERSRLNRTIEDVTL
jgi:predicted dehydrogenase